MKKIVRNLATDEGRAFWASAERIAAQANNWPASKLAGINVSPVRATSGSTVAPESVKVPSRPDRDT